MQQTMGSLPWENQAAAGQGASEPVPPGREEPEQMNSVQGEPSSVPLRPSQMKKMKEQQRTDQQTAGGSSITIKKPEINVQKYKGSIRKLSKMQIAVIIDHYSFGRTIFHSSGFSKPSFQQATPANLCSQIKSIFLRSDFSSSIHSRYKELPSSNSP